MATWGFDGAPLRPRFLEGLRTKFWHYLAAACIGACLSVPASAASVATFTLVNVNLDNGAATGSFDFNLDTEALSNVTVTLVDSKLGFSPITFNQAFVNALPNPGIASVSNTLFSAVPPAFLFKFAPGPTETDSLFLSLGETPVTSLQQPLSTANVFPGAAFPILINSTFAVYRDVGTDPGTDIADGVHLADGSLYVSAVTTTTPLPAALPLFASGLAGLGWLARRRRKHAAA